MNPAARCGEAARGLPGRKRHVLKIWATGVLPGLSFGAQCTGHTPAGLRWASGRATALVAGGVAGAYQHSVFALHARRDPATEMVLPCILRYVEEVWMATDPQLRHSKVLRPGLLLHGMAEALRRFEVQPRRLGPLSAALYSLRELAWRMESLTVLCGPAEERILLTELAPCGVQRHLREAVRQLHEREAVVRLLGKGLGSEAERVELEAKGADFDSLRRAVHRKAATHEERRCLTRVLAG